MINLVVDPRHTFIKIFLILGLHNLYFHWSTYLCFSGINSQKYCHHCQIFFLQKRREWEVNNHHSKGNLVEFVSSTEFCPPFMPFFQTPLGQIIFLFFKKLMIALLVSLLLSTQGLWNSSTRRLSPSSIPIALFNSKLALS